MATLWLDELHVTSDDISTDVLFDSMPVALNCCVEPMSMAVLDGVTVMDVKVPVVSDVAPLIVPKLALMVQLPAATAVTTPWDPAALFMVATAEFEELHVTDVVMSREEPSE